MWTNIKVSYPRWPNGGMRFLVFNGEQAVAFFHIDPNNGEKWWESTDGNEIKGVTHWQSLPKNPDE